MFGHLGLKILFLFLSYIQLLSTVCKHLTANFNCMKSFFLWIWVSRICVLAIVQLGFRKHCILHKGRYIIM